MEEYEGIISKVIFYNPENKYIVAAFETDDEKFTIIGNMSYVNNDDHYRIKGSYVTHPRYGKQFKVSSYEIILADDRSEIIRYLSSSLFKGVGKKTAERIVDALGEEALTLIKDNPDCLNNIPNVTETIKKNIVGVLTSQDYDQQVLSFFMGNGISTRNLPLIQNFYKEKTLDVLQNDPYRLIDDIEGIGFKSVDELAMKTGVEPLDDKRIQAGILASLMDLCFQTGSTYSDYESFYHHFRRMLPECPDDLFAKNLDQIIANKVIQEEDRYYPRDLYESETMIAEKFERYLKQSTQSIEDSVIDEKIKRTEELQGITYDEIQKNAIKKFLEESALILTGGPGTGKTVVAINLLSKLTNEGLFVQYTSKNSAPRNVYAKKLTGHKKSSINNMFKGAGSYIDVESNIIDTILCDEGHRLTARTQLGPRVVGENQIKEIMNACLCSVFFIDESQRVTLSDIGSVSEIRK